jgi:hypothetical protein
LFSRNPPKYLFLNLIKKTKKYLSKSSTEENGKEKSVLKFFIQKKKGKRLVNSQAETSRHGSKEN